MSGEAVDLLTALLQDHRTERREIARRNAGLLDRFTAGCLLERLARVGQALGYAPRRSAVVVARRVDEQHFDALAAERFFPVARYRSTPADCFMLRIVTSR